MALICVTLRNLWITRPPPRPQSPGGVYPQMSQIYTDEDENKDPDMGCLIAVSVSVPNLRYSAKSVDNPPRLPPQFAKVADKPFRSARLRIRQPQEL